MLPSNARLTTEEDFKRVEEKGHVFQSQNFGVAIFDRGDIDPTRFGFIVSTKISFEATTRNYAKRKMREGVRRRLVELKPGLDIVFLAKQNITRVATDQIMKEVALALQEAGLLK